MHTCIYQLFSSYMYMYLSNVRCCYLHICCIYDYPDYKTGSPKGNDRSSESQEIKSSKYFEYSLSKRTTKKKCRHHFSNYKVNKSILTRSKVANFNACGQKWLKFKLILDIMHFLVMISASLKPIGSTASKKKWRH